MTGGLQALLSATSLSGGGGAGVSINNRTVSNTGPGTGTISVGYKLDNDGSAYKVTTATTSLETWLDSGAAADYEVRATKVSGTSPTGAALATWLAMSADRTWTLSAGAAASTTCVLTVEIRDVATHTVLDTATITLSADNSGGGGGGGGGGTVSITNQPIEMSRDGSLTVTASYSLNSDGNVYSQAGVIEGWLDSGVASSFESRVTVTSGSLTSGSEGTWQALSTTRTWTRSVGPGGTASVVFTVEIRDASSHTVLDTATITITIDNTGA